VTRNGRVALDVFVSSLINESSKVHFTSFGDARVEHREYCRRLLWRDQRAVAYLDRTGSGNETAAHLKADGRLTLMFCAFDGPPNILRLYGRGEVLRRGAPAYAALLESAFGGVEPAGARQIVRLAIDLVQTSCGYGTPLFAYRGERPSLDNWAHAKGEAGLKAYWREKNLVSIDGLPTGLLDEA